MSVAAIVLSSLGLTTLAGLLGLVTIGRTHRVADWGGPIINTFDGINRFFCRRFHRMHADPIELPESGGALIVANHISGLDPVAILAASPRPLRFLIASDEYEIWWLNWVYKAVRCIPVDRVGRPDKAMRHARDALEAGEVVCIFPQGRFPKPGEKLVRPKRGAIFLADLAGVPIVPLHVSGVGAPGKTVGSVFVRSQLRIRTGEALAASMESEARSAAMTAFIVPELHDFSSDTSSGTEAG